jgi:cation diffusion facilitator family transporter
MRLSLAVGVLMLVGKTGAYWLTGSSAILSDAAESVVHLVAVLFAAFSVWLVARPANSTYHYGYERISFFSAGFEGAMIVLAALFIMVAAIQKWLAGLQFERLGAGTLIVAAAAGVNALLGAYLIRTGRQHQSLILEANGTHILTDSWTSLGVIGGLCLVLATGWKPFDPLCAIAVALNILWSGADLMRRSIGGLMDRADPALAQHVQFHCEQLAASLGVECHGLRLRDSGHRLLIEIHLLFPYGLALGEAHRLATEFEARLETAIGAPADVTTHLEAVEDHDQVHLTHRPRA